MDTTAATTPKPRYRVRATGTKHDYIRRYVVIDSTTGRRVRSGLSAVAMPKDEAQEMADELNGIERDEDAR